MQDKIKKNKFLIEETLLEQRMGRQLLKKRQELGLTSEDVAKALAIPHAQFERYEQGTESVPAFMLAQIARYYEVEPGYFLEK